MRIAQVAPLAESVPPKLYGGTERVVAWLVDELVSLGHDVTLFASGDSKTTAKLHAVWPQGLRLGRPRTDPMWSRQHCWKRLPDARTSSMLFTRISIGCICRSLAGLVSRF